jgi:hypothetical protein
MMGLQAALTLPSIDRISGLSASPASSGPGSLRLGPGRGSVTCADQEVRADSEIRVRILAVRLCQWLTLNSAILDDSVLQADSDDSTDIWDDSEIRPGADSEIFVDSEIRADSESTIQVDSDILRYYPG